MRKSIDNFDKKLTEKSTFLYDKLLKNTIIPEIERKSVKELPLIELAQIEENLTHVVENFTENSEKFKKIRKLFHDFKERRLAYQKYRQISGQRNSYSRTTP